MRTALFIDRDGTLNVNTHYTHLAEDLYLCKDIIKFFSWFTTGDFLLSELEVVIVTNQSGVANGYYTVNECLEFETELSNVILAESGYWLDPKNYYHDWTNDDNSWTRKPNPGMLLQACKDLKLKPGYMIGDKDSDVIAGSRAGCNLTFNVNHYNSILTCLYTIRNDIYESQRSSRYGSFKSN